jgi:Ni/Co efflux regulator RcnB
MECMIRDGDRSNPRPDNLRWATRAEIAAGRDVRGTQPRGEQVTSAKLTEKDVRAARRRYKTGASISALARRYGVSRAAIRRAIHGENWGHVTGD